MNASPSPFPRNGSRATAAFCLLVTVTLMVGALPYRGIRHDGILYMGQALSHLNPAWAAHDLFFAFGSQDQFSVFSRLMAVLLRHVDAGAVDMAVLALAALAWLAGLFMLVRDLPAGERWLAVLAVVGASHYYGSGRIFDYMEPYVTARTWAEPMAVFALAALLRGRWGLAALAFLLSLALHPLVAVPVGAVALAYLIAVDRRWAALLLLAIPLLGLAFAGVAPFAGLLRTYDPEWFQGTLVANEIVYVSNWSGPAALAMLVWLAVLWLVHRRGSTPFARLARAVAITTPILFLVSFVGADLLHDVLVTQLQLWRVSWVLNLLAVASLPTLLRREWSRGPMGRCAAIAVFVAVYATDGWVPTAWLFVVWAGMALALGARGVEPGPSLLRLAKLATLLAALVVVVLQWLNAQEQLRMHLQGMRAAAPLSVFFALPLMTLPIAFGLVLAWRRGGLAARVATSGLVAGLLVVAVAHWDQRTPWARYIESAPRGAHPFDALVPPGAQVYWHEDVLANWVLLQRANFISNYQTSGLLFSRGAALLAEQRVPPYLKLLARTRDCGRLEALGAVVLDHAACDLPRDAFLGFCHLRPAHPDFLIAPADFGTGVVARWTFVPGDGSASTTYALYDCRQVP